MVDKQQIDPDKVNAFGHSIILVSFHKESEIDTRVAILENVNHFMKIHKEPGDKEALEEVQRHLDDYTFEEICDYYDACLEKQMYQEQNEMINKEEPVMKDAVMEKLFSKKKINEPFVLYLNGEDERSYYKVRSFDFENERYVLLKDDITEKTDYYKFKSADDEIDDREKLIRVKDELLIKLFKSLEL